MEQNLPRCKEETVVTEETVATNEEQIKNNNIEIFQKHKRIKNNFYYKAFSDLFRLPSDIRHYLKNKFKQ